MQQIESGTRNSNHEILRILATLMVLGLHYLKGSVGGALDPANSTETNLLMAKILESICIPAVNIFVLITGYYSYRSKKIKINKACELYTITIFYSLLFLFLQGTVSVRNIVYALVPFLEGEAWFVETYIILLFLIPFLNHVIEGCSQKSLAICIFIQFLLFSFWPTFFQSAPVTDGGYGITNFVLLYFIGAYFRKYEFNCNMLLLIVIELLCVLAMSIYNGWWSYCSVFCIASAASIFLLFTKLKNFTNGIINKLADFSFAVYIIHSNSDIVHFWYRDMLKTDMFWTSHLFVLHFLVGIIVLFFICVIIDSFRRGLFKYTITPILKVNKFSEIRIE